MQEEDDELENLFHVSNGFGFKGQGGMHISTS